MGYSSGDTASLWVTAEGILPVFGLQQRGYCQSLGYSRGDTASLWVTAEGILPLSVCQRGDTATVCLSERGYCTDENAVFRCDSDKNSLVIIFLYLKVHSLKYVEF